MRAAAWTIALVVAFGASAAHADDTADLAAQRAEALAEEGYQRFVEGKNADAIEAYARAYEVAPSARMLLNIAEIYDSRLGDRERALAYYRRYLAEPDAEPGLALYAKRRIDALLAPPVPHAPHAKDSAKPTSLAAPKPTASPLRTWGFVAGGVGLGAIAVGTAFAIVAKSRNDEAARSCVGQACTDPRALSLTDEALTAARIADVALVAGGVLIAVGGALIVVAPTSRGVAVSGSFR